MHVNNEIQPTSHVDLPRLTNPTNEPQSEINKYLPSILIEDPEDED